jgi:hypothetical protein
MAAVSGRHVMFASVRALAHSYAPGDGAREGRFMNKPVGVSKIPEYSIFYMFHDVIVRRLRSMIQFHNATSIAF